MEPEIVPAILVKERGELLRRILLVRDFVKTIQIDVMDGEFVPNKTQSSGSSECLATTSILFT